MLILLCLNCFYRLSAIRTPWAVSKFQGLFFAFFDEDYADGTEDEQDTCCHQHTYLRARAYIFKDSTTNQCSHDLRQADGTIEQTQIITHIITLERVSQNSEWYCQHRCPCCTDECIRHKQYVLVGHKQCRNKS